MEASNNPQFLKSFMIMKLFVQIFIDPDPSGEIQMFWNTV